MKKISLIVLFFFICSSMPVSQFAHAISGLDTLGPANKVYTAGIPFSSSFHESLQKPYDEFFSHYANDPVNVRNGNRIFTLY